MFNIGYNEIYERVQDWYPNSMHSLHHNNTALRLELKDWARGIIELGEVDDWVEDAANTRPDEAPEDVNIWVDSVDYQIQGRRAYGKKSDKWSYKLSAPGRRYMIFRNGLGKVIKIFGGYSPKIRDYMWIEERADWINESLDGETSLATTTGGWECSTSMPSALPSMPLMLSPGSVGVTMQTWRYLPMPRLVIMRKCNERGLALRTTSQSQGPNSRLFNRHGLRMKTNLTLSCGTQQRS